MTSSPARGKVNWHRAITGSQRFSADLEPAISAVRSSNSADRIVMTFTFESFEPSVHFKCDVIRVDFFHPPPANNFGKWCSHIFEHTLVNVIKVAVGPSPPHKGRNRLHYQTKLLLAARKSQISSVILV